MQLAGLAMLPSGLARQEPHPHNHTQKHVIEQSQLESHAMEKATCIALLVSLLPHCVWLRKYDEGYRSRLRDIQ